jgi:hypothetical protein
VLLLAWLVLAISGPALKNKLTQTNNMIMLVFFSTVILLHFLLPTTLSATQVD